jgi:hypothetical protein
MIVLAAEDGRWAMAENSYHVRPTLFEICNQITIAVAFAELYAEVDVQHAKAFHAFCADIKKHFYNLREVVSGKANLE